jgi:hypothetical protein
MLADSDPGKPKKMLSFLTFPVIKPVFGLDPESA